MEVSVGLRRFPTATSNNCLFSNWCFKKDKKKKTRGSETRMSLHMCFVNKSLCGLIEATDDISMMICVSEASRCKAVNKWRNVFFLQHLHAMQCSKMFLFFPPQPRWFFFGGMYHNVRGVSEGFRRRWPFWSDRRRDLTSNFMYVLLASMQWVDLSLYLSLLRKCCHQFPLSYVVPPCFVRYDPRIPQRSRWIREESWTLWKSDLWIYIWLPRDVSPRRVWNGIHAGHRYFWYDHLVFVLFMCVLCCAALVCVAWLWGKVRTVIPRRRRTWDHCGSCATQMGETDCN